VQEFWAVSDLRPVRWCLNRALSVVIDYSRGRGIRFALVKQITIGITLFLFFLSSSLGSLEQLSARFDADSQTSLWTLDDDFSSENARGRRSLKRSQRGKSSLNSLRGVEKPASAISRIVRMRESFISHYSKSSVYQQINVYRI
jgi:hypothetical protein